jgi:hypothetical protein
MSSPTTLAMMISTILLAAPATQAQPADPDEVLSSTEEWTDADINDDDTLSQSELNRAEPTLATSFGDIDRNNDRRISRDELEAWQAGPEPGDPDADELATGEADRDDSTGPESDQTLIRDEPLPDAPDDLLPDDGDKATELLPDDADDDTARAGEVERESGER